MERKVLLIDDDPDLGKMVGLILRQMDIILYQAYSGPEGLKKSYEIHPDLILLDIMMPGMSGFDVCIKLREVSSVPVLMLTAKAEESDILRGFTVGADDYMKKPFNKNELEARVYALLRRSDQSSKASASYIVTYEDPVLHVDMSAKIVKLNGEIVEFSPMEYSVLAYLVREQGKVVSKHDLIREVWGEPVTYGLPNPSIYIFYLRKKIQDGCHGHHYIHTLWGRGYWFEPRKEEE
jgi:DNA-binding response OmpR family regulator